MNFKALTVAVMLVVYLYELFLDIVRYRSARNPIPQNVADVYDTETYLKWKAYHGEKVRWGIFTKAASFVIDLALILFNAYAAFAASGLFAENAYAQGIAVMILSALANLLLIPFTWHDTMHIEEKYGFNRTGKKTFWGDQLKSFLIGLGLMCGISCLVTWAHGAMGDWLILALAVILTLFILFFSFLYPFFSRIFNKFTPLPDGELKEGITKLLEKNGLKHAGGDDAVDDLPHVGGSGLAGGVSGQLGHRGQLGVGLEDVAHDETDDDAAGGGGQVDDDHADTDPAHVSGRDGGRAHHQGAHDDRDDDHLQQPGEDGAEHADPGRQGRDALGSQDDARHRADDQADEDLVEYVDVQVCPKDTAFLGFIVCHRFPS